MAIGATSSEDMLTVARAAATLGAPDDAFDTAEESGLLGSRFVPDPRGPWLVQYWESEEKLYAYASTPDAQHRPAWTAFNARARQAPGAVGIWHETFVVDRAESIYVGMPVSGLAAATSAVPVGRRSQRAAQRLASGTTKRMAATVA